MAAKHGLGRGLGALIQDGTPPVDKAAPDALLTELPASQIEVNPRQPRDRFVPEDLAELTASIKTHGILQPLLVRRQGNAFELVAGERRLRAARQAGLERVPVRLVEAADRESLELAMVENLQRADLNPMEEARGYQRMADDFNLSQDEIAARVGKARATVANAQRLLDLPEEVQGMVREGRLSVGHAKVLLGVAAPPELSLLARRTMAEGLSVRALEKLVARLKRGLRRPRRASEQDMPPDHLRHLTEVLHQHFGTAVRITPSRTLAGGRKVKGMLEIDFYSNDDLHRLLEIVGAPV
ncbi:MAG: ParB/RepB/Spo0J family partition protein [Kiritimatiellia bacterium]|nr:ParB/RepB/Spo0J family partition protein [Lentisphaerota bacterium]